MKKFLFFIVFALTSLCFYAQEITITGTVSSSTDNFPLPGASVIIKGSTKGTTTDIDGNYSISVPNEESVLLFGYVGMESQEVTVGQSRIINVALNDIVIEEVVITALGMKREVKALGYSQTSFKADEITESGSRSALNALQGKVAGVNISSSSGAPGSSTRILMRGVTSLSGGNQPLVVLNGVPISNEFTGSSSINGGTDFGNKLNDINPEDIESINVLKGARGTALYGSRAANGVIIITTKQGTASEEKPIVSVSSVTTFEQPLRLVKYQNEFGQGLNGETVPYENTSWGPLFDGQEHVWGYEVDNAIRIKPYKALPTNVNDFFDIGRSYNNTVSVNGGNDIVTYYMSYGNVTSDGIFPTNTDFYKKHTATLNTKVNLSEKLSTGMSLTYIRKDIGNKSTGQGSQSIYDQIMQTPRDISLKDIEDINNDFNNIDNYYSLYTLNPYFILNNNGDENHENRVVGNLELNYDITPSLSLLSRFGMEVYDENIKRWRAKVIPEGNNKYSSIFENGSVSETAKYNNSLNLDVLLAYKKNIKNFDLSATLGYNINQRNYKFVSTSVGSQILPNLPSLDNSSEPASSTDYEQTKRNLGVNSLFEVGYKSVLFASLALREEWSSTLPPKYNNFFYPGGDIAFVFTEVLPKSKILSFGKIRASYGKVGNDTDPYQINSVYVLSGHSDGFGFLSYPINGITSYEVEDLLGNPELKPELTTEYELGADIRFFNNRAGIDFTYYDKTTTDLIWPAPMPYSSGYRAKIINLGEMNNKGVEVLFKLTPIAAKNFKWEIILNYSKNYNTLVSLNDNLEKVTINGLSGEVSLVAKPGQPVGVFEGRTAKRTNDGKIIVDTRGLPIAEEDEVEFGTSPYKFTGGVINTLSYKNFTFSANVDVRMGGKMYSRTKDVSAFSGTIPATLYNMREPFIVPNSVYESNQDEKGNPVYTENTIPITPDKLSEYWSNGGVLLDEFTLIDKSFVKLRSITLSYNVPKNLLNKMPFSALNIGVVGTNVWLWTPKDQIYIDPELTTFGTDIAADFGEFGATPTVKSWGINLKFDF